MNRQRKVVITTTYNELGIIIDTKAEELDSSAQPEQTDCEFTPEPCKDVVPRTSIEYICRKNTVSTNPYEHKYHDKFIQFMDDPEISDFGRWQHSNGFNTALVAVMCDLDKVPSAQQERKPGRWIPYDDEYYECSVCGVLWVFNDGTPEENEANFCQKCGADLRGGSHVKYD